MNKLSLPLILFQYSFVNLETGEETGRVIDRSGNVKAYRYTLSSGATPSSENEAWHEADLANLYALATEIDRLILNLSGHINRYETSTYATNLHQWLWNLNEGL